MDYGRKNVDIPKHTSKDYLSHLEFIGRDFKKSHRGQIVFLSGTSKLYLEKLMKKLKRGGGVLFSQFHIGEIVVLRNGIPFHFSMPNGRIFLSQSLLERYINNEGLLASVLVIEMIKSHKSIFKKNTLIPKGFVSLDDLDIFLRIDLNTRTEINKWATYVLLKSGFDPLSILRLLQIKNKNFLDFFNDPIYEKHASAEEVRLKNFFVQEKMLENIDKFQQGSSKFFRIFINEIKGS